MSHPSPLTPALERAHSLVAAGDLAGAAVLLERAIEIGQASLSQDHPDVLATQRELASLHHQAGKPAAAKTVLEAAHEAGQFSLGDDDPLMLQISYDLGVLAEELGNGDEARVAFGRVADFGPMMLGPRHWAVTRAQAYLGQDPTSPVRIEPAHQMPHSGLAMQSAPPADLPPDNHPTILAPQIPHQGSQLPPPPWGGQQSPTPQAGQLPPPPKFPAPSSQLPPPPPLSSQLPPPPPLGGRAQPSSPNAGGHVQSSAPAKAGSQLPPPPFGGQLPPPPQLSRPQAKPEPAQGQARQGNPWAQAPGQEQGTQTRQPIPAPRQPELQVQDETPVTLPSPFAQGDIEAASKEQGRGDATSSAQGKKETQDTFRPESPWGPAPRTTKEPTETPFQEFKPGVFGVAGKEETPGLFHRGSNDAVVVQRRDPVVMPLRPNSVTAGDPVPGQSDLPVRPEPAPVTRPESVTPGVSDSRPAPASDPEPVVKPPLEPAPVLKPTPEPAPAPDFGPIFKPAPRPEPAPAQEVTPAPKPVAAPEPTQAPTPAQAAMPAQAATSARAVTSAQATAPTPVQAVASSPASETAQVPVVKEPDPIDQPTTQLPTISGRPFDVEPLTDEAWPDFNGWPGVSRKPTVHLPESGHPGVYTQDQGAPAYQQPIYQPDPQPTYQQDAQAGYQQPTYQQDAQAGYQQPTYQQDAQAGYQQAAYQQEAQTGYQQPAYEQDVRAGYQQPAYQQPGYEQAGREQAGYQEAAHPGVYQQQQAAHQSGVYHQGTDGTWQGGPGSSPAYDPPGDLLTPYAKSGSNRRRGMALFAVIAATMAAVVAVAALVFSLAQGTRKGDDGDTSPNSPTLSGAPPAGVKLNDLGTKIDVSWTDPTDATVSFMVTMAHPGEQLKPVSTVGPGQTSRRIEGLSASLDYCFAVVAVYGTNKFATSPQVCTDRGKK